MNERKTPGQVNFEAHGGTPCSWDCLFDAERKRWEEGASAVIHSFTGPNARTIGIGDEPPPPPPPPPG